MKLAYAATILILSIVAQISFVRLLDIFSFTPNLPLVALFLLCYLLPFKEVLFLSVFTGLALDLFSSMYFGTNALAVLGAYSLSFYIREKIFRRGGIVDFLLNSLITFVLFYCLLAAGIIFLNFSENYAGIFNLININLAGEILLNFIFSVLGYCLIVYLKNKRIYGFIGNVKILS